MIVIVAKCRLKNGAKKEFIESGGIRDLIEGSRQEEGNLSYDLCQDTEDEKTVAFIEKWRDPQAIEAHNSSPHFLSGLEVIRSLSEEVEIRSYSSI